jgi:VanZ family protein
VSGRFLKYWLPLLLWMALIFTASTEAGSPLVSSFFLRPVLHWIDPTMSEHTFEIIHICCRKAAHLTEYAALGFLALRMARAQPPWNQKGTIYQLGVALFICALYASTDEFHQSFVPTRHPAVTDVMIDTTGAAAGLAMTLVVERMRRPK